MSSETGMNRQDHVKPVPELVLRLQAAIHSEMLFSPSEGGPFKVFLSGAQQWGEKLGCCDATPIYLSKVQEKKCEVSGAQG